LVEELAADNGIRTWILIQAESDAGEFDAVRTFLAKFEMK